MTRLKKPVKALALDKSLLSLRLSLLAALMYKSSESQLMPVALPLLRCERVCTTCDGVALNLRFVPPLRVEVPDFLQPLLRDGGWSFSSTWICYLG